MFSSPRFLGKPCFHTPCGSPLYVAPELCNATHLAQEGYGMRVDVWAVGVMTYALLVSQFPFNGETNSEIMAQVRERALRPWRLLCRGHSHSIGVPFLLAVLGGQRLPHLFLRRARYARRQPVGPRICEQPAGEDARAAALGRCSPRASLVRAARAGCVAAG